MKRKPFIDWACGAPTGEIWRTEMGSGGMERNSDENALFLTAVFSASLCGLASDSSEERDSKQEPRMWISHKPFVTRWEYPKVLFLG